MRKPSRMTQRLSCFRTLTALLLLASFAGCMKPADWNIRWFENTRDTDLAETLAADAADEENPIGADQPPTAHTLYSLASILAAQGRDRECQIVLIKTIRDYPEFLPAYCNLAELHLRQNRVSEAVATLQAGLAVAPGDPVLTNNLGMCSIIKGDYDQALAYFTEAAGANPGARKYRANMGLAIGMQGRYEESLALYRQVVGEEQALKNLEIILAAKGDTETKVEDIAAQLDRSPVPQSKPEPVGSDIVGAGLIGNDPAVQPTPAEPDPVVEPVADEPTPEPAPLGTDNSDTEIELNDAEPVDPPAELAPDPVDADVDETEIILGE